MYQVPRVHRDLRASFRDSDCRQVHRHSTLIQAIQTIFCVKVSNSDRAVYRMYMTFLMYVQRMILLYSCQVQYICNMQRACLHSLYFQTYVRIPASFVNHDCCVSNQNFLCEHSSLFMLIVCLIRNFMSINTSFCVNILHNLDFGSDQCASSALYILCIPNARSVDCFC